MKKYLSICTKHLKEAAPVNEVEVHGSFEEAYKAITISYNDFATAHKLVSTKGSGLYGNTMVFSGKGFSFCGEIIELEVDQSPKL